jgi:hypothetical protein
MRHHRFVAGTAAPVESSAVSDPPTGQRGVRVATTVLVLVGVAFFVQVIAVLGVHTGFGVDEVDYLARVNPSVPELYWTAVRAWGVPVLAAPVALFSAGLAVVRLYFAVLLSAGLVLAFLPWRRVLPPAVAPLAAVLFGSAWITTYFGNEAMPNLPVAYCCIAATGIWAGLPRYRHRRRGIVVLGFLIALVALIRPTDSLLLVVPIAAFTILTRDRPRRGVLVALVVGEVLGWAPWVIEAYATFGGPLHRWREGSDTGLTGIHPSLVMFEVYPRLFDWTPGYCCYANPASSAGPASTPVVVWFIAVAVLAVLGLVVAARQRRLTAVGLAATVALAFIVFYLGLLDYGAPRFLLPILGLLSIPIAAVLVAGFTTGRGPVRIALVTLCLALVAGHLVLQADYDRTVRPGYRSVRDTDLRLAVQAKKYVHAHPCLVISRAPQTYGYYLGCHVVSDIDPEPVVLADQQRGWTVLGVMPKRLPPSMAFVGSEHWRRVLLPYSSTQPHPRYAYLPRGQR